MLKFTFIFASLVIVSASIYLTEGIGLDLGFEENDENSILKDDDDRAIIVTTGINLGNILGINLTSLLPLLTLGATTFLPLLSLLALAAVILAGIAAKDKGHDSGYGGYSSSYSRALGLDRVDWEKLSIIDWVAMGEEVFRKFDPSNLDCQKRVICELHQNAKEFGPLAGRMVDMFGYLQYAEILSLPEMVKSAIGEYVAAAERGRSLNKDCGDIYSDCDFSIKSMYDRYSDNLV